MPQWRQSAGGRQPQRKIGRPIGELSGQGDHVILSRGRSGRHVHPLPVSPYQALGLVREYVYHYQTGTEVVVPYGIPDGY